MSDTLSYSAFEGHRILISGTLDAVALEVRRRLRTHPSARILIFSDSTGKEMDIDITGSESEMMSRLKVFISTEVTPAASTGGPGRPKLGVIAREVSLLPRHWEWLAGQSGGASAALRRLIEDKQKNPSYRDVIRQAQDRTYKFMTSIAGDFENYEEALRALYAKDRKKFQEMIRSWPRDIRDHAKNMARPLWD